MRKVFLRWERRMAIPNLWEPELTGAERFIHSALRERAYGQPYFDHAVPVNVRRPTPRRIGDRLS